MIVVVIIGLLAAMAVPAFKRVRVNSENKTVVNNVRQILGAAEEYFIETGATTVALQDLMKDGIGDAVAEGRLNFPSEAAMQARSEDYPNTITDEADYVVTGLSAGAGNATVGETSPNYGSTDTQLTFSF